MHAMGREAMSPTRDDPDGRAFQARLESELLQRHGALYGARRAEAGVRRRRMAWVLVPAILLGLAAIGAAPAHLTLGLGQVVTIDLPPGTAAPGQGELLVRLLDARIGAAQASASVDPDPVRGDRVLLLLFGRTPGAADLRPELEQSFPALASGSWQIHRLDADLETSLARALGWRVFAIPPDPGAIEQRRRQVIEKLASAGRTGEVKFTESDGIRMIEVTPDSR
jgi:hypothetical protein